MCLAAVGRQARITVGIHTSLWWWWGGKEGRRKAVKGQVADLTSWAGNSDSGQDPRASPSSAVLPAVTPPWHPPLQHTASNRLFGCHHSCLLPACLLPFPCPCPPPPAPRPLRWAADLDRTGRHTWRTQPHATIGRAPKVWDPSQSLTSAPFISPDHARVANASVHSPGPKYLPLEARTGLPHVPTPVLKSGQPDRFYDRFEIGRVN